MDMFSESSGENKIIENFTDLEFKKPLHPAPKKKRRILSEEIYVKNLQAIIERDFFPNLEELRERVDLIKANESNNIEKLQELHEKFIGKQQKNIVSEPDSPATFDTPLSFKLREMKANNPNAEKITSSNPMSDELSLDAFMANYTSEDNSSFEEMMEKSEALFRMKHSWLFEAEAKHNSTYTPNLALLSTEIINKAKMLSLVAVEDINKDIRPKTLENWSYQIYNSLMYVPDGVKHSDIQKQQLAKVDKKEVIYENTRFKENPFNEEINQATMIEASAIQAYKKEGKVGIDGKELSQTPMVNGYSYLRTPSPAVGVEASPFMTWGHIEGTPYQLDGSESPLLRYKNTPGPSYKIPKASERDELLLRLNEKVNQNHKKGKQRALSAARAKFATPNRSSMQRVTSMSPAAQNLLRSNSKGHTGIGAALKASYTPSPNRHITQTKAITTSNVKRNKTPLFSGITDNILNLPKRTEIISKVTDSNRKHASDFF